METLMATFNHKGFYIEIHYAEEAGTNWWWEVYGDNDIRAIEEGYNYPTRTAAGDAAKAWIDSLTVDINPQTNEHGL